MNCKNCNNVLSDDDKFCSKCGRQSVVENEALESNTPAPSKFEGKKEFPVTQGRRLVNYILDIIIAALPFSFALGLVFGLFGLNDVIEDANETALWMFILLTYYIIFESAWQKTPAKWITKTKVVNEYGDAPSFGAIIGRSFSRLVPFDAFSFLAENPVRGWHDKWSSTYVVPDSYTKEDVVEMHNFVLSRRNK